MDRGCLLIYFYDTLIKVGLWNTCSSRRFKWEDKKWESNLTHSWIKIVYHVYLGHGIYLAFMVMQVLWMLGGTQRSTEMLLSVLKIYK